MGNVSAAVAEGARTATGRPRHAPFTPLSEDGIHGPLVAEEASDGNLPYVPTPQGRPRCSGGQDHTPLLARAAIREATR